jgi:hypothetical protein
MMNSYSYDPKAPKADEYGLRDDWLVEVAGDEFHIGQTYDKTPAQQRKCTCGCVAFHIGRGDYYTAIRCMDCRRELCIHEG